MRPLIDGEKTCRICKETKPISEYHPNKSCKQGVLGTCKSCYKIRISKWYSENRSRRQQVANERNKSRKLQAIEYFGNKCFDCNTSYPPYVYQFHHLDPTQKDVNPSVAMTRDSDKMWKELKKCVMLCANCHMIRHFGKEAINATTH